MPHHALVVLALLVAATLAAGSAGCAAQTPNAVDPSGSIAAPLGAVDPAQREGCFANEQAVESHVVAYQSQNPGVTAAATLADMVAQGMLKAVPMCPAGGSYSYDATQVRLTCSIHGHY